MDVAGTTHTVPVTHFKAPYTETIADFDVALSTSFTQSNISTFLKSLESD